MNLNLTRPSYGNSVLVCGLLVLILLLAKTLIVSTLEESLCVGTGYYLPGTNISDEPLLGHKSSGWNNFFDKEVKWASVFWVADHRSPPSSESKDFVQMKIRLLEDENGKEMVGWLALEIFRESPFQFIAIWAVTQKNEAHGNFLLNETVQECSPLLRDKHSYVTCSAVPINSEIVPNMIISGNFNTTKDEAGNVWAKIPSSVRTNNFSVLWHAGPTNCFGPEKFRFMVAASSVHPWDDVDWNEEAPFKTMDEASDYGPIIFATPWIQPSASVITSIHESVKPLVCKSELTPLSVTEASWIVQVEEEELEKSWFEKRWTSTSKHAENLSAVKKRATCKGAPNGTTGLVGRCPKHVNPLQPDFLFADESVQFICPEKKSRVKRQTNVPYTQYMEELYQRVTAPCECPPGNNYITGGRRRRSISETTESNSDYKSNQDDNQSQPGVKGRMDSGQGPIPRQAVPPTTTQKPVHALCDQRAMSRSQQVLAGMCIYSEPGKLAFGVRQWHGLTSLIATLVITPMSVMVARYHKGFYMMRDGKLPLRAWYLVHILLIFPAIWMHASGFAALTRQRDVIGVSLSESAKFHRMLGYIALCLMLLQILTGFLRPINVGARKCLIAFHCIVGYLQHLSELFLCIFSSQIPGSPTNSHSILNTAKFGNPLHAASTVIFLAWFAFSTIVHVFQMIRIKVQDKRLDLGGRSLCPIIIPVLATTQKQLEDLQKQAWIEKAVLVVYSLVSGIIFFIISVSMYQILYDKLYYGFGPMTCSHESMTKLRLKSGC